MWANVNAKITFHVGPITYLFCLLDSSLSRQMPTYWSTVQSVEHVRLQTWGNHNPEMVIGSRQWSTPSFIVRCSNIRRSLRKKYFLTACRDGGFFSNTQVRAWEIRGSFLCSSPMSRQSRKWFRWIFKGSKSLLMVLTDGIRDIASALACFFCLRDVLFSSPADRCPRPTLYAVHCLRVAFVDQPRACDPYRWWKAHLVLK